MTGPLAGQSPDATLGGPAPAVGEHVACYRPTDGARVCGTVVENRAGLFLTACSARRIVLTAARWWVYVTPDCP